MKLTSNTKILRKILILCVLTVGLMFVASNEATPVSAKSCYEANNDFFGSLTTFDSAFISYHYDSPAICSNQCSGLPQPSQQYDTCVTNCRNTYRGAISDAEQGILGAGEDIGSCTNPPPDRCAQARGINDYCFATYNYLEYPAGSEERMDIFNAYSLCRHGSGVDSCQ